MEVSTDKLARQIDILNGQVAALTAYIRHLHAKLDGDADFASIEAYAEKVSEAAIARRMPDVTPHQFIKITLERIQSPG